MRRCAFPSLDIVILVLFILNSCTSIDLDFPFEIRISINDMDFSGVNFDWAESEGTRNVLRRATQLAAIRWSPLLDVPNNHGYFAADSWVIGIPYSSTKQINKYVGFDVSFHTFMTAVHNPHSVLYTENIGLPPYNGVNCACYYGTVCSAAVAYALDYDYPITANDITRNDDFQEVVFRSLNDLKVCDILHRSGHVFMIYKLEKDSGGEITDIVIFESSGTSTNLKRYSAELFKHRVEKEDLHLYRYLHLDGVEDYEPTPFVPIGSESIINVRYNEALCPNRGDKSVYGVDEPVIIDVLDMDYDTIIIEKGGTVYDQRPIVGNENEIGCLQAGYYKVYLTNKGFNSDSVEIIVADPKVIVSITDKICISFHCDNAKPVYCSVVTGTGGSKKTHVLDENEISQGYAELERVEGGPYYYKVIFETPFGTIINNPILADSI